MRLRPLLVAVCLIASLEQQVHADETDTPPAWLHYADNEYYKLSLNVRPRVEIANVEGVAGGSDPERSEAVTMRTLFGVGTKPVYGLSAFVEGENAFTIHDGGYFNVNETPTGQTGVADPTETELNQAWGRYQNDDILGFDPGLDLKAGRQRIKLDDDRFIGNVGWRQNEQTYDAALGTTSLGFDGLSLTYGYIWEVRRIFGNDGPVANHNFDSESDLVHFAYEGFEPLGVTAFAYLLDFDDSAANSSNTYGIRAAGSFDVSDDWSIAYSGSYAHQTDGGNNPLDYDADYIAAEGGVTFGPLGSLAVGHEHLGSDDGKARFITPLATAHKFNGWADVFIDNGGPDGLDDLYVRLSPNLPWDFGGEIVFHQFWADEGDTDLGHEIDAVLSRPITKHLSALTKFAYYDGTKKGRPDIYRWWFQLVFAF